MERDRKTVGLFVATLIVIFGFSYAVGYYVGKQAGIREERERCKVEKKQLMKTLARIAPVSRPQPKIEEKVVGPPTLAELQQAGSKKEEKREEASLKPDLQVATAEVKGGEKLEPRGEQESPVAAAKPKEKAPSKAEKRKKDLYYLQVGVFKSSANARKLVNALKAKGFNAKILRSDGTLKVIVGYFGNRSSADAVKRRLKRAGYDSIIKWRKG